MSSSMPTLKAPTNEPLKDAECARNYVRKDITQKHMAFDYRTPSPTMMAYYNTFKYLVSFGDVASEDTSNHSWRSCKIIT